MARASSAAEMPLFLTGSRGGCQVAATGPDPLRAWTEYIWRSAGIDPRARATAAAAGPFDDAWGALIRHWWEANPLSKSIPIDPADALRTYQRLWAEALLHPERAISAYTDLMRSYTQLLSQTALRMLGYQSELNPLAVPDKADRRFSAPEWQLNPLFDAIKQAYLLAATTLLKHAEELEGLDPSQKRKVMFYLRQFVDAASPSNFLATNPEALREALATGGQSLVKGIQNLLRDLSEGQIKMVDKDAFAPGRNIVLTPGQVVFRNKLIELIQYNPQTETVAALPLVFIPNWINKYYILDLQPENSLIKYLTEQGFTVFVISWKNPDPSMEEVGFEDYMELGPLTAFRVAREITNAPQVNAVGYCIGGTLLAITLAYLARVGEAPVNAATFFVSLLDFAEVGDTAVFVEPPNIRYVEEQMREKGVLESRQMATMFNLLRANDLIWSFVVNNYLLGKEPQPFDLLYWNDDGTRMTRAAHTFYLRNTYVENNLIKPDAITMKGVPIDLRRIRQDIYAVGTELDHLVPWRTAWRINQLTGGKVRFVVGGSGHIAGVINPPHKGRGYLVNESTKPAASAEEWLEGAERRKGSWWSDWVAWLRARSGEQVPPPPVGGEAYPPIVPAPGTYVLEK